MQFRNCGHLTNELLEWHEASQSKLGLIVESSISRKIGYLWFDDDYNIHMYLIPDNRDMQQALLDAVNRCLSEYQQKHERAPKYDLMRVASCVVQEFMVTHGRPQFLTPYEVLKIVGEARIGFTGARYP